MKSLVICQVNFGSNGKFRLTIVLTTLISFLSIPAGNQLNRYSKVLDSRLGPAQPKALPACPKLIWSKSQALNISVAGDLYHHPKLLWIGKVIFGSCQCTI